MDRLYSGKVEEESLITLFSVVEFRSQIDLTELSPLLHED